MVTLAAPNTLCWGLLRMPLVPEYTKSASFFAPSSFSRMPTPFGFKSDAISRKICLGLFGAANATATFRRLRAMSALSAYKGAM